MAESETEIEEWWRTSIIDMEPGKIAFWKHPIEELIGNVSFPQMIWLMLRGELPSLDETKLNDPMSEDHVSLMTIHQSKGLEFKYVYLVGLENGLFPSQRNMREKKND